MPDISEWGTKNVTLADPTGYAISAWGRVNATVDEADDPPVGGSSISEWGTENVTVINPSDGDWGRVNVSIFEGARHYEWQLATASGWVPARFMAFVEDQPSGPTYTFSEWGTENATLIDPAVATTRDYLKQPYNSSSIWNTPIGTGAEQVAAGMPIQFTSTRKVSVDPIYLGMNLGAPQRPIRNGNILDHQTMPALSPGAIIGTGTNPVADPQVRIPDNVIWNSGWNGIFGGIDADTPTLAWTGQALNRPTVADNPTIYRTGDNYPTGRRGHDDLYGPGRKGAHGGGQCGGIGGTLRAWEYDAAIAGDIRAINHRLALNVYGVTTLSTANNNLGSGLSGNGWRWPAYKADSNFNTEGANNYYGRTGEGYDGVVMGSLLALPSNFALPTTGDPLIQALAWTLKHFGCHIVDVVGLNPRYAFSVEFTRKSAWDARAVTTFHEPLVLDLITKLVLIDDCTPTTPGGAGSPRTTPPPPLA